MADTTNRWPDGADPRLCESFPLFLTKLWRGLGYGKPTPVQLQMAQDLQDSLGDTYGGRMQIIGFRGVAKSYITVAFCVWLLYRWPDIQVLNVSATGQFAGDNASFAWTLIHSFDWLSHMRPTQDQARSKLDFDVRGAMPAKGTSFAARGINGQITGLRADIIVGDDVETPNTSETPGARASLEKRVGEFSAILKVTTPVGVILFLGTPQTEETLYRTNETKGYTTRIYPIHFPTEAEITRYGEHRLPKGIVAAVRRNPALAGTSTDPSRFTDQEIAKRRREWGEIEFQRQFKMFMDVGSGQSAPLLMRNLIVMPLKPWNPKVPGTGVPSDLVPPDITMKPLDLTGLGIEIDTPNSDPYVYGPKSVGPYVEPRGTVMTIDPSGDGLDETAWAIGTERASYVFLLAAGASLLGYDKTVLEQIAKDAKQWNVNEIIVEKNFGQDMFAALLRPVLKEVGHSCLVTSEPAGGTYKEARIIGSLQPLTSKQQLVVNTDFLRWDFHHASSYTSIEEAKRRFYRFTYQFTRMREVRKALPHEDRLEAVSEMAGTFAERLEKTSKEAQQQEADERFSAEMRRINAERKKLGLAPLTPDRRSDIQKAIDASGKSRKTSFKDRFTKKRNRH